MFGAPETDRNFYFDQILPRTIGERLVLTIWLPQANLSSLTLGAKSFCDNCELAKDLEIFTVHVIQPPAEAAQ